MSGSKPCTDSGIEASLGGLRGAIELAAGADVGAYAIMVLHARVLVTQLQRALGVANVALPPAVEIHRKWLLSRLSGDLDTLASHHREGAPDLRKHAKALLLVAQEATLWLDPSPRTYSDEPADAVVHDPGAPSSSEHAHGAL
ncbi:MAG: hypothetical protein AAF721_00680 [Myxococcota bacterium]